MNATRTALLALLVILGAAVRADAETPERRLDLPAGLPGTTDATEGAIQFIGTATVILRHAGFTILTDPNFLHKGDHVHLGYGLTSERLTDPAVRFEDLPPIDLVLLSHFHGDHFDALVQERLDRRTPIVTTQAAARRLQGLGFQAVYGLEVWETLAVTKGAASLRITAMPGRHGPPVVAAALPDVMGSLLDFGPTDSTTRHWRMYVSGDTLVYDDLREIPRRYPGIDLALLHLGGTRVLGILVTMDAEQGVEALRIVDPRIAIPIHYDDYTVFKSPLGAFKEAVRRAGLEAKVRYLARGETYRFTTSR